MAGHRQHPRTQGNREVSGCSWIKQAVSPGGGGARVFASSLDNASNLVCKVVSYRRRVARDEDVVSEYVQGVVFGKPDKTPLECSAGSPRLLYEQGSADIPWAADRQCEGPREGTRAVRDKCLMQAVRAGQQDLDLAVERGEELRGLHVGEHLSAATREAVRDVDENRQLFVDSARPLVVPLAADDRRRRILSRSEVMPQKLSQSHAARHEPHPTRGRLTDNARRHLSQTMVIRCCNDGRRREPDSKCTCAVHRVHQYSDRGVRRVLAGLLGVDIGARDALQHLQHYLLALLVGRRHLGAVCTLYSGRGRPALVGADDSHAGDYCRRKTVKHLHVILPKDQAA